MKHIQLLQETAPYRALVYRFWSAVFLGRLAPEVLDGSLEAAKVAAALACSDEDEPVVRDPFEKTDPAELERAFAKLFYGVGDETIVLTKSAVTGTEGLSAGRSSERARAVYFSGGLVVRGEDLHLPEDHIGIVLGYLAELAGRSDAQSLERERAFLNEFLLSWWPVAFERIRANPQAAPALGVFEAFDALLHSLVELFEIEFAARCAS